MDTKFQTSFIPKKALAETAAGRPRSESVSVVVIVSVVIFILSVAVSAGVFIYQKILVGQVNDMDKRLIQAKNSFETGFIETANTLNRRIEGGKRLLTAHAAVTPLFDLLENDVLATVKFDEFSYDMKDGGNSMIALVGQAKNFSSVALQSDIFGQDKSIVNPVFSGLNTDKSGNIVFKFNASLDPNLVSYQRLAFSNQTIPNPTASSTFNQF